MAHTELDLRERRAIEDMLNAEMPVSKIAAEIGRHRSTVYREIKRNHFTDDELPYLNGYYGMVAQRNASERRARRRKLIRLENISQNCTGSTRPHRRIWLNNLGRSHTLCLANQRYNL